MAYVVEQKYFDSGHVTTRTLTEEDLTKELGETPQYNTCISGNNCDTYYDKFDTKTEAYDFEKQAREA